MFALSTAMLAQANIPAGTDKTAGTDKMNMNNADKKSSKPESTAAGKTPQAVPPCKSDDKNKAIESDCRTQIRMENMRKMTEALRKSE